MESLSQALERTMQTFSEPEPEKTTPPTPRHGLTPDDGRWTTAPDSSQQSQPATSDSPPLTSEKNPPLLPSVQNAQSLPLRLSSQGQDGLEETLSMCFDAMKNWGKQPESLPNTIKLFSNVLADCPVDKITSAFNFYSKYNEDYPSPAAIYNIIKRGNKPAFDKQVYGKLEAKRKNDAMSMTKPEWAYIREYEQFMIQGN